MEMEQLFGQPSNYQDENSLISVFDVILGLLILALMMIFLFVSFGYLLDLENSDPEIPETVVTPAVTPTPNKTTVQRATTTPIPKVAVKAPTAQEAIYQALLKEFQYDLPRWTAEIDRTTLTVRFHNPDSLFELGRSSLNQHYKSILADFFPRYVNLLKKHQAAIEAISIEGHTSSEWRGSVSKDEAYFNNMALSQARTRAVLEYCLRLPSINTYKNWLRSLLTANGLSSSRLIMDKGFEKVEYSRRVEFRIYTLS
jgi:outer membrane protein OmpA-like peptidoglycan-associated protein